MNKAVVNFKKNIYQYLLLGIMVLAVGLRGIGLTKSPPSLYWEEAALGYDAYSILKTGKDFHGNPWPIVAFESFGDWKPSGYFYVLVPFLAIFGLNEWSVRLPSCLAGVATVLIVYLLTKKISKREDWALWSALIMAVLPWSIQFSRAAFEVNLATFMLTLGVYWLILARKNQKYLVAATLPMVASMYTYHGLRLLAPILTLSIILFFRRDYFKTKYIWLSLIVAGLLVTPLLKAFNSPQIQQRIKETSVFAESRAIVETNEARQADGGTIEAKLIHHRYLYWEKEMVARAISFFNPGFLFISGDKIPNHQIGYFALLFPWMLIPLLVGLSKFWWVNNGENRWLGAWVLLAVVPLAVTNNAPHSLRFLPAAPAVAIIIGLGLTSISRWGQNFRTGIWINFLLIGLITLSVVTYGYELWGVSPKRLSQKWEYGYREVLGQIKPDFLNGKNIYFTRRYGRPSIYAMFYWQLEPAWVQTQATHAPKDQGELLGLGNIFFDGRTPQLGSVIVSEKINEPYQLRSTINFLDGKPAFYIYEN